MALNSLLCADVPLRNCSINQSIWATDRPSAQPLDVAGVWAHDSPSTQPLLVNSLQVDVVLTAELGPLPTAGGITIWLAIFGSPRGLTSTVRTSGVTIITTLCRLLLPFLTT